MSALLVARVGVVVAESSPIVRQAEVVINDLKLLAGDEKVRLAGPARSAACAVY
jgi:hypothetical protein